MQRAINDRIMGTMTQPDRSSMIRRWRIARAAYIATLFMVFAVGAFYVGPNYLLFGKATWITPADYEDRARVDVMPIVRAIKEYAADHGELPSLNRRLSAQLVPNYLPPPPSEWSDYPALLEPDGTLRYDGLGWHEVIVYDLKPASEGWHLHGPFTSGPLSLPLVTIDAASRPTTRPATRPH